MEAADEVKQMLLDEFLNDIVIILLVALAIALIYGLWTVWQSIRRD